MLTTPSTRPRFSRVRRAALLAIGSFCLAAGADAGFLRVAAWNPRVATPTLGLDSIDGERWDLASLRGRVVVLNFWATWCEPCLAEMPQLAALAKRHGHDRLVVLGINHGEGDAAIRRYIEQQSPGFPILKDPGGSAFRAWQGKILPTTVLVARDGRARYIVQGELDWDGAEAAELLGKLL
jgi:thiol-disulfide isomerase/thioredoxin